MCMGVSLPCMFVYSVCAWFLKGLEDMSGPLEDASDALEVELQMV